MFFLLCPSPYHTKWNQISHVIRIGNLCHSNSITKMMKPFLILDKDDDAYGAVSRSMTLWPILLFLCFIPQEMIFLCQSIFWIFLLRKIYNIFRNLMKHLMKSSEKETHNKRWNEPHFGQTYVQCQLTLTDAHTH